MSEKRTQESTLVKFGLFSSPSHNPSRPAPRPDCCPEKGSNYTFKGANESEDQHNTFDRLSNHFSLGNHDKVLTAAKGEREYFMLENVSFGKKCAQVKRRAQARGHLEVNDEPTEAVNLYSGKTLSNPSARSSKSRIMRTLKTSDKSGKSGRPESHRVERDRISEFSSGTEKARSPRKLGEDINTRRTVTGGSRKRNTLVARMSSGKSSLNSRKTSKNRGKEESERSRQISPFGPKVKGQAGIFADKGRLIRAFEVGRKTPNSKKLSLDFQRKDSAGGSQKKRKHLSIHVGGEGDFNQLSRQYFSSKNSNVADFKPFVAGKSSILKLRESRQASGVEAPAKFSTYLAEQRVKGLSGAKTPPGLFSKYLYRRKGREERGSPNFKKKGDCEVLKVERATGPKTPSRKLASFFNKNNPQNKRVKFIASQRNAPKKASLAQLSKRLSNRRVKIAHQQAHESLNENSMMHIQNRVDIETLINSKLVSSRTKNTFLKRPNWGAGEKSETSIVFGRPKNRKTPGRTAKPGKSGVLQKIKKAKSKGSRAKRKKEGESWNLYKPNSFKKKAKPSRDKPRVHKKTKPRKVVLRKSPNLIISRRKSSKKSSKTPGSSRKLDAAKRRTLKKLRSSKGPSSLGKRSSKKKTAPERGKKTFFKTQFRNLRGARDDAKSASLKKEGSIAANQILLFKNIKDRLTSSFKKRQTKLGGQAKSSDKAKSLQKRKQIESHFKSHKKKLKLGSISPSAQLQSFRLRPYSKTPNAGSKVLNTLMRKWPKKRSKLRRTKGVIESVSCLEKSILDSRIRQRDPFAQMMSIYTPTQNPKKPPSKLKIANLFSKHELQKKIQRSQKENFSKFNLSSHKEQVSRPGNQTQSFRKTDKSRNLISIKFNLDKRGKEGSRRMPVSRKKSGLNAKIKRNAMRGWIRGFKKEAPRVKLEPREEHWQAQGQGQKQRHELVRLKRYLAKKKRFLVKTTTRPRRAKKERKKCISKKNKRHCRVVRTKKGRLFVKGRRGA